MRLPLLSTLALATVLLSAHAVAAQVADSTVVADSAAVAVPASGPDSLSAGADSLAAVVERLPFAYDTTGVIYDVGRPARRAELGLHELLQDRPGVMPYAFGAVGWPSTFSPFGLDPNRTALAFDGHSMDDLITGRPRFDLLPTATLDSVRLDAAAQGAPYGVTVFSRNFDSPEPQTDLRYASSKTGLQSIDAVHTQSRPFRVFGPNDRLELLFGYAGAASDGEYPGSRLAKGRQLQGRIRLRRPDWSLEIYELYNRRNVGAQGGVLPIAGRPYSSIYQRVGASVVNPEAVRTTVRNDLRARFRTVALVLPLSVDAFWSAETLQYRSEADTVTARVRRAGFSAGTEFGRGPHSLRVTGRAWVDVFRSGNAFLDGFDHRRRFAELTGAFSTSLGDVSGEARAGLHSDAGKTFTSASVALWSGWFRIQGSTTGQRWSWMDRAGFGLLTQPAAALPAGRINRASARVHVRRGWFGASVTVFYHDESDLPLWRFDRDTDEAKVEFLPGGTSVLGAAPELALRSSADLGIYGFVRPTFLRRTTGVASGLGEALRTSIPEFWVKGRLGVHALLFQHDLDLDLSARTLYWASMNGRRLDIRTGLVMLPLNDPTSVPSSWTLDVVAEAGVRGATIFLAFENLFSGTNVLIGNLIIPDYPLPAQRFRFGVFWPISN